MAKRKYENEELLDILREAGVLLGRLPTMRDFDGPDIPGLSRRPGSYTFKARFGSWSKALHAAFGKEAARVPVRGMADEAKLRRDLRALANELHRPPTAQEMSRFPGAHHANTYIRHYGSWKGAVQTLLD